MTSSGGQHPSRSTISVVVPVLNGLPFLEDQLEALVDQDSPCDWELVVVDNGSTDQSVAVARRWAGRHPRIRVVDASTTYGAPGARNAGVRAATGDRLLFCDADDVVQAGWLAGMASALDEADVVAGVFDFWSLNGLRPQPPRPASMRQLGYLPAGLGANLAVRRDAFETIGGFTEALLIGEDIDLCWRLQLAGYRFLVEFKAVVAKRERHQFAEVFRQASHYGRSGPTLYRRHRRAGARPNLTGAAKSWLWLAVHLPRLAQPGNGRIEWARAAGMRTGRLAGSVTERVFFP